MVSSGEIRREATRLRFVWLAMLAGLLVLAARLWRVQVLGGREYAGALARQTLRRVRLPGIRGRILDRHGVCLADNRPSYCIAIYVEELPRARRWEERIDTVDAVVDRLAGILRLERQVSREEVAAHVRRRQPLPFLAWRDIDRRAMARWAEHCVHLRGVDLYVEPVREYPRGDTAGHVLGYMGRAANEEQAEREYYYYLPEYEGKAGAESAFNERLCGEAGGKLIRVDAMGFKHEEEDERPPGRGADVRLALDTGIQALAERALLGERGSAVVLDPRNGDVLALASAPAYDPNSFTPSLSHRTLARLNADPGKPFFNRAIQGAYPPGSTFKPVVALAALQNEHATPRTRFSCGGRFEVGGLVFHCWNRRGHGEVAMREAIEQSCNPYFCQLGLQCGYNGIYHLAAALGLGRHTGIELGPERPGLLPDSFWKQEHLGDRWRSGDTCNVSIGQGALLVTPVQMACVAAAIANGGRLYRPRLLLRGYDPRGEVVNRLNWSEAALRTVRGGMYDVVQAESGTGKRARIPQAAMGGKTGTAEYGPRSNRKNYAWMIAFAPFEQPRYAAAIVIEDAASGGITAAPRIRQLMQSVFTLERERTTGSGGAG